MYKETRIVQASEIGYNHQMRLLDVINMIQDVEGAHIEHLKPLSDEAKRDEFGIILNFRYVHIKRWPKNKNLLELITFPYETKSFYGYRNTLCYDLMGELLIESYCVGSFIHLKDLSPHRLSNYTLKSIKPIEKHPMKYEGRKIELDRALTFIKEEIISVKQSHIDYYQHLNNAFYVDFAYNMLPRSYEFNTVIGEYKKSFKLDSQMHLKLFETSEGYLIKFFDTENELYTLIEFKNI